MRQWVECVPNFSEGRDPRVAGRIGEAIASVSGVLLLNRTMDADHNRSVFTFVGSLGAVTKAVLQAAAVAVEAIDLRKHSGVHPRIGALDVLPFVPLEGVTREECVSLARRVGNRIWEQLHVPVYFYGEAATTQRRRRLENIRRGGFEALRECLPGDADRLPDLGGPALHPSAGACAVGVRKFLIAYNIQLSAADVSIAKQIAREIRESSGGLPGVKALGLELASRNLTQVSINLTDYEHTPPHVVFDRVRREAQRRGTSVAGTELIGLIPKAALAQAPKDFAATFRPDQILENRIESLQGRGEQ